MLSSRGNPRRHVIVVAGALVACASAVGAYAIAGNEPTAPQAQTPAPAVGGSELGTLVSVDAGARLYVAPSTEVGPSGETDMICYSLVAPGQPLMGGCGPQAIIDKSGSYFAAPPSNGKVPVWLILPAGATQLRIGGGVKSVSGRLASVQIDATANRVPYTVATPAGPVTQEIVR